jgi:hypothetical protein
VIFSLGFSPWWPSYYSYYPDDYDYDYDYGFPNDGYGSSTYRYDYQYPYNYAPDYNSGDYQDQGQMYYEDSYPDQSQGQGYYDSGVYQSEVNDDPHSDSDQSQSDDSIVVAAQERLARQGYYRGEADGMLSAEMQKAIRRYQSTNGLRQTGDLDSDTLAVMGLSKDTSD